MILDGLDEFVVNDSKPSELSFIYYFFLEKGLSPSELDELPLPFLFEMLSVRSYLLEEERKASKRRK